MLHLALDTVTVINRRYNSTTARDEYKLTVINNVSWYGTVAAVVELSGLRASDTYVIRFPAETLAGYVDPVSYTGAAGQWTLATGDVIVKGVVNSFTTLSDLQHSRYEYATVRSVTDDRRAPNAPHIKVTAL